MIKNLVKDVPTEQLNESIKKYIPMILSNSSAKQINKNERVLKESRKPTILTGENKQNKVAMNLEDDMGGLDVDAEISKVIENGKFNF
jgi:F420-dependent methylenetetrahydromethanopterin dehydrogenase